LPLGDDQGSYIAKFPSTSFPGVSENEYANLALAEAIGMDVPERELVEQSEFEGIPKEFETLSDGKVLLVKRFDRGAAGADPYRGFRAGVRRLSFAEIRRSRLS
jgi:serine/threonine-protein kinase HipA